MLVEMGVMVIKFLASNITSYLGGILAFEVLRAFLPAVTLVSFIFNIPIKLD